MTPAAEALVRSIAQIAGAGESAELRAIARLACNALHLDGHTPEVLPELPPLEEAPRARTAAERMRDYRRRRREGVTPGYESDVTRNEGGVGGDLSDSQGDPEQEGRAREGRPLRNGVTERNALSPEPSEYSSETLPTGRVVRNASDDGCFGDTVGAWCEGVAKRTGGTYERRSLAPGAVRALVEALNAEAFRRGVQDSAKVAMARELGVEYADAQQGATLNPFAFASWLGSNRPRRDARPGVAAAPAPVEGPRARAVREAREASEREARENATPMPEELRRRVGLGGKRP